VLILPGFGGPVHRPGTDVTKGGRPLSVSLISGFTWDECATYATRVPDEGHRRSKAKRSNMIQFYTSCLVIFYEFDATESVSIQSLAPPVVRASSEPFIILYSNRRYARLVAASSKKGTQSAVHPSILLYQVYNLGQCI
jgi:hypothetical protein